MRPVADDQFRTWAVAIGASDQTAFAALFNAMYGPLQRYAAYIVHDDEAAADLVQEVFAKVWQVRADLDPERSLRALLFQMMRNQALNHERRRKRHQTEELEDDLASASSEHSTDDEMDASALGRLVQEWIDEMPERRREAFLLSRREGLSHEEIAQLMGLAPKTVNNHIVLALQYIRTKLDLYRQRNGD
jgi:RNA polymerase sigma-70 factor (ECF subfamily)